MDLISRQAAIDAIKHHGEIENDYTDIYHDGYCDGIFDSVDTLEQLPSAQPEITKEAVELYCRQRCLTVITNERIRLRRYECQTAGGCSCSEIDSCNELKGGSICLIPDGLNSVE